jgi:hypothetical protein
VLVAVALTAAVVAAAVIIPAAAGWGRVTKQPNGAWSGWGNVHRATAVHISRVRHHGWKPLSVTRYRPSLARRLYFDFCVIVGHPAQVHGPLSCPAEYSLVYDGTFYAGSRTRATFDYEADGCQALELATGGSTQATIIMGRAALAEPDSFDTDLAAVLGIPACAVHQPPTLPCPPPPAPPQPTSPSPLPSPTGEPVSVTAG